GNFYLVKPHVHQSPCPSPANLIVNVNVLQVGGINVIHEHHLNVSEEVPVRGSVKVAAHHTNRFICISTHHILLFRQSLQRDKLYVKVNVARQIPEHVRGSLVESGYGSIERHCLISSEYRLVTKSN